MKEGYIPQNERKKILFLCDDIRLHSGIATMAREIVIQTAHKYNWVNLGAALKNPDQGKKLDISGDVNKNAGIEDASVIIYPSDGYGNADVVRFLIANEKPDAIFIFTDPRYWVWLFQIENEIRRKVPLVYLNIWDDYPAPLYNEVYYNSCDSLMAISKQTLNINKLVLGDNAKNKILKYVPHGIDENVFFPITQEHQSYPEFLEFKKNLLKGEDYDFVLLWNSRNIRRKNPGDVILSFKHFCSKLPKEKAKKCALVMHTQPIDDNGTNLLEVRELLCDENCNVIFSDQRLAPHQMNYLYNCADGVMLISSNEGWGLSLTEGMMAGRMIIANTTGGMQDQMRFEDEDGNWIDFNEKFCSNHYGTYKKCGDWAIPVFPSNISLVGSVPTPYIFDDRCDPRDVAEVITKLYELGSEERIDRGLLARKWVTSDESMMSSKNMSKNIMEVFEETFKTWTPRERFSFEPVNNIKPKKLVHEIIY